MFIIIVADMQKVKRIEINAFFFKKKCKKM